MLGKAARARSAGWEGEILSRVRASVLGPTSICFIGKLFGEAELLAVAKRYQDATPFHGKHPTY